MKGNDGGGGGGGGGGGEVAQSRESESHRRLQSLVTQLRKAANHPYLFQGVETPSADGRATEELVKASGKMVVLDQLLKKLHQRGHRVVLFSQYTRMLDIIRLVVPIPHTNTHSNTPPMTPPLTPPLTPSHARYHQVGST